jgi:hypothetical protein
MRTKFLKLSLVAMVAASSVYGLGGAKKFGECGRGDTMPFMKKGDVANDGMKEIMMTISDMDLSKSQYKEIKQAMLDLKEQRFDTFKDKENVVFMDKDGNFDKEKFIKDRTSISKDMIEAQAKAVEKFLSILSEAQRKTLASKISI